MPEEINRLLTDAISDYLFVTEQSGYDNLIREGIDGDKIFFSGNVMIDSLMRFQDRARAAGTTEKLGLAPQGFVLMTMHRPATVDVPERLAVLAELLETIAARYPVVLPLHPRTRQNLEQAGLLAGLDALAGLHLAEPFGYLEFLNLMMHAGAVVTDSGGVQEETTFLKVPCLTLRDNTERPVTVELGTNVLLPLDVGTVAEMTERAMTGGWKQGRTPPMWDGQAAERIASALTAAVGVLP
jgi:UDP-N-acetylglucosamine 2-epimerase (non-hydrolysing)